MSFCSKCGKEVPTDTQFCPSCGNAVASNKPSESSRVNETTNNSVASVAYNTIQYNHPGYEQAPEQPKKKNILIPILIVISLVVIGAAAGAIKYLTGDAYKYKNAVEILNSGDYETAFNLFYSLGNYEDSESYLPFHGKYRCISYFDKKSVYTFKNGEYTETFQFKDNDERQYHGTFESDEYRSAVLTEDEDESGNIETKMYQVYENYIYEIGNEGYIFKENVDISDDCLSGIFSKALRCVTNMIYFENETYVFEEDGTFSWTEEAVVYESDEYEKGEKIVLDSGKGDGTYKIKGNIITLTSNEDGSEVSFLILDGKMYSKLYVRDY